MTKEEHIAYWLKTAEHDWDTANHLFETGRHDWCLFISHLVIETEKFEKIKELYTWLLSQIK